MNILPVKHKHDKLIIVASGSSLNKFDKTLLEKLDIPTIAVNSEYWKFHSTYWCTIDPTGLEEILYNTNKNTYKYVGFKKILEGHNLHNLSRYVIDKTNKDINKYLLCEDPTMLQTHNSAYAAFNLAYHMGVKKVVLLGVDADTYNYPTTTVGYQQSISILPQLFESALPQIQKRGIQVISGSLQSNVVCFPKVSIEEALNWIKG